MMQTISFKRFFENNNYRIDERVFGEKVSILGTIFGCRHEHLSRPFEQNKTPYIVCLECGARKQFSNETFQTFGAFYHPPIVRDISEVF